MKKLFMFFSSTLLLILLITPIANAQENSSLSSDDLIVQKIKIDSKLTIEKRKDGRIVPVENTDVLTDNQLDSILKEMNLSDEMIKKMPKSQKEYYASKGGVAVNVETKLNRYFRTSDGQRLLITDENRSEIEALRQKEIEKINTESALNLKIAPLDMGEDGSGSFRGWGTLIYLGRSPNATEFEFEYGDSFSYDEDVSRKYTDKIAHAWQSHTTSVNAYGEYWWYVLDYLGTKDLTIKNEGSVYGHSGSFKHPDTITNESGGFLVDTVRIPVTNKGTTGKWVTRYSHPWTLITPDVTIGPLSLDFSSFVGDDWEWENTFTIQAQ